MPELISFSWTRGSDLVTVQAIVEDAVQVSPATLYDPPEFGSAPCTAVLLWDDPITHENAPTQEQIERMLAWIDDWVVNEPIDFDDA